MQIVEHWFLNSSEPQRFAVTSILTVVHAGVPAYPVVFEEYKYFICVLCLYITSHRSRGDYMASKLMVRKWQKVLIQWLI